MATPQETTTTGISSQFPINTLGEEGASTEVEQVEVESQVSEEGADSGGGGPDAQERERAAAEEARRYGWVPKEEWQSDPARWRSATDFLAVREQVQAFKADETAKLRAKVAALEQREQARLQAETEAREKITAETLRSELRLARENQDWDKVDEITEKLLDHKVAKVAPKSAQATVDPAIVDSANRFKAANPWVETDRTLGASFALTLKNIVDLRITDNFDEALKIAKEEVQARYPARFPRKGNGSGRPLAETGGTSGNGGGTTGRTWNDLKPFYRQSAERDIAKKMYTREEYLANCADDPAEYFRS